MASSTEFFFNLSQKAVGSKPRLNKYTIPDIHLIKNKLTNFAQGKNTTTVRALLDTYSVVRFKGI